MTDKPMTREQALEKALRDIPAEMSDFVQIANHIGISALDGLYLGHAMDVEAQARAALALPVAEDKDGERWRKFRSLHWSQHTLCAVADPKQNVRLGGMCPSGEHLDSLVDALTPIERAHGIQGKEG